MKHSHEAGVLLPVIVLCALGIALTVVPNKSCVFAGRIVLIISAVLFSALLAYKIAGDIRKWRSK